MGTTINRHGAQAPEEFREGFSSFRPAGRRNLVQRRVRRLGKTPRSTYRGLVAEATGANIFFIKDGVIRTPTPDCFLNGITRQIVIELAKRRGIEVIERAILPEKLPGFGECFLTGSAAEVTPVSEIGPYRFTPSTM